MKSNVRKLPLRRRREVPEHQCGGALQGAVTVAGWTRRTFLKSLGSVGAGAAMGHLLAFPRPARGLDHVAATFEALVDVILPVTPRLEHATGAVDLDVDEFVMKSFDSFIALVPTQRPGIRLREVVAGLLDVHAQMVTPGKTFLAQTPDERVETLAALDESPSGDVRFVSMAIYGLTLLGFYTEWPRFGRPFSIDGDELVDASKLPVWKEIAYPGPAHWYPRFSDYHPGFPVDPTSQDVP